MDEYENKTSWMYFDQEPPDMPVAGLIAEVDYSDNCQLEAIAVFRGAISKYLVVYVTGCSCWPVSGSTEQHICHTKTDVQHAISSVRSIPKEVVGELMDELQACDWKVTQ